MSKLAFVPLPSLYYEPSWSFDSLHIYPLLEKWITRPEDADYHIIRHAGRFVDPVNMYSWIAQNYRWWNQSAEIGTPNFLLFHFCDHFTDCNYPMSSDPLYSPSSPTRIVRHIVWNGRDDIFENQCEACFTKLDIVVPTAHNACGSLCGGTTKDLKKYSVWDSNAHPSFIASLDYVIGWPERPVKFFYSGQLHPHQMRASISDDVSGRAAVFRRWQNHTGYEIIQSYDWEKDKPVIEGLQGTMLAKMRNSTFCFSPPGHRGGDHDRYIPALLTGCVPVIYSHVYNHGRTNVIHNAFEGLIDWDKIAVFITPEDVDNLDDILDKVDFNSKRAHVGLIWRRLLWTSIYGSELGETPEEDAIHTLIKILENPD